MRIRITGAVQGVGFRPHVYRMATGMGLRGWVLNNAQGVVVEAEGAGVQDFVERLRAEPPVNAVVRTFEVEWIETTGDAGFAVRRSDALGEPAAFLLPDLGLCRSCLGEVRSAGNRRYQYPFTTCTHCGPRYSIVEGIPYDRPLTSMKVFPMCVECDREYRDPADRRFHAQTNCCAECGPQLELWGLDGEVLARRHEALERTSEAVRAGRIVALKGLGGFHLIADARNAGAIRELRERKRRPAKPFAVMACDVGMARELCAIGEEAERLLESQQAPIVLLDRASGCGLPEEIAPGNPTIGLMLPYTPLHALLMDELAFPIVATSGNLTDDPICYDEREALDRLRGVADAFLVHNRPIMRPVDDSVVRFIGGEPVLLRRARGYAPLPLDVGRELPELFATGAHMKNTVAFSRGRLVFVSQHLGDLESEAGAESHEKAAADFMRVYEVKPRAIAHDLHPDYGSTKSARQFGDRLGVELRGVQHHEAHILAAMAENGLAGPVLGASWDGSGYGTDGAVWGGEFFRFDGRRMERLAHFREFPLAGGEQAVREPRRSMLGLLRQMGREDEARHAFAEGEWKVLRAMLDRHLNCPLTTSAGRLFDAAAALAGLRQKASFEGQAAMELEFAARIGTTAEGVPMPVQDGFVDWAPLVEAFVDGPMNVHEKARLFHNSMAGAIVRVAFQSGLEDVVLAGGCFQNALLTELASARLKEAGFRVWTQKIFPPNDGSIALGQILAAAGWEGSK